MAKERPQMKSAFKEAANEIALIQEAISKQDSVAEIPISLIYSPKTHDRKCFDDKEIEEMANSIRQVGLLQPIIVRKVGGKFERLVGFKRMLAVKLIGATVIKSIVLENITDSQAALITISENLFRSNPNIYDQTLALLDYAAIAMKIESEEVVKLLNKYKAKRELTEEEVVSLVDLDNLVTRSLAIKLRTFADRIKVLNINPILIEAIQKRELNFSVATLLDNVKNEEELKEYINRALVEKLTSQQVKEMIGSRENKEQNIQSFFQKRYKKSYSKLAEDKQILINKYLSRIDEIISSQDV